MLCSLARMSHDVPTSSRRSHRVEVDRHDGYEVVHEPGLLRRFGALLRRTCGEVRVTVLTDSRLRPLYGAQLAASLHEAGLRSSWVEVAEGERSKTLTTFAQVLSDVRATGLDRRGVLVNFGGGVISDLGGFVASAYLRGVRYANLATSLIAQVDAAVGGKVAVNVPEGKNLVGAFHHPCLVAADAELLRTLGHRDFRSGIAEVVKIAILGSQELFAELQHERHAIVARDAARLTRVAAAATRLKMDLVSQDPYEHDLRRPLNLGHTLGHPIETDFAYEGVRHGEAVAVGIAVATLIANRRGTLANGPADAILRLLDDYDLLGCTGPLEPASILNHLRAVRLVRGGRLHFVLPTAIGAVQITDELGDGELVEGFEAYERLLARRRGGGTVEANA